MTIFLCVTRYDERAAQILVAMATTKSGVR